MPVGMTRPMVRTFVFALRIVVSMSVASDCVWMPARLTLANGGEHLALLPARYPGSEAAPDGALQLARRTEWQEPLPGVWTGLGQRVLATDAGEHALMDVREIVIDPGP